MCMTSRLVLYITCSKTFNQENLSSFAILYLQGGYFVMNSSTEYFCFHMPCDVLMILMHEVFHSTKLQKGKYVGVYGHADGYTHKNPAQKVDKL